MKFPVINVFRALVLAGLLISTHGPTLHLELIYYRVLRVCKSSMYMTVRDRLSRTGCDDTKSSVVPTEVVYTKFK